MFGHGTVDDESGLPNALRFSRGGVMIAQAAAGCKRVLGGF
jgi:hypothetical protein